MSGKDISSRQGVIFMTILRKATTELITMDCSEAKKKKSATHHYVLILKNEIIVDYLNIDYKLCILSLKGFFFSLQNNMTMCR